MANDIIIGIILYIIFFGAVFGFVLLLLSLACDVGEVYFGSGIEGEDNEEW